MLKQLGTFAIFAVCLFAIVIVMGGCDGDKVDPPIVPTETPMEKLTGSYTLIEVDGVALSPGSYSKLELLPRGNGWSRSSTHLGAASGPTWSASDTTITFTYSTGGTSTDNYTLEGNLFTLTSLVPDGSYIEGLWRKE